MRERVEVAVAGMVVTCVCLVVLIFLLFHVCLAVWLDSLRLEAGKLELLLFLTCLSASYSTRSW